MKRRAVLEDLDRIWLTLIVISQGIWLMFTLLRPGAGRLYMRSFARISVAAASSAIHQGGAQGFPEAERKTWPGRGGAAASKFSRSPRPGGAARRSSATATSAPDGASYRISYYLRPNSHYHGVFGIPMEVVIVVVVGAAWGSAPSWPGT